MQVRAGRRDVTEILRLRKMQVLSVTTETDRLWNRRVSQMQENVLQRRRLSRL